MVRILRDHILNIPARQAAVCAAKSKKKEREILKLLTTEAERGLNECAKALMDYINA